MRVAAVAREKASSGGRAVWCVVEPVMSFAEGSVISSRDIKGTLGGIPSSFVRSVVMEVPMRFVSFAAFVRLIKVRGV